MHLHVFLQAKNFRLTYTVSTQNVSDFRLGSVPEALEVITGPYTSSQIKFSDDKRTYKQYFICYLYFILCASKNGTFHNISCTCRC